MSSSTSENDFIDCSDISNGFSTDSESGDEFPESFKYFNEKTHQKIAPVVNRLLKKVSKRNSIVGFF